MYKRIRDLREDKDMTQKEMAQYLGIHQTTYSDYELGNLNIPIPALIKIATLFGTSIDYLVGITDERRPYPSRQLAQRG
ncbi:MAG: helix-turn-helix transcriptional regulator [Firmicutes bacterium]|nr:helix-turn-helix transcriptional regulator [Bacillota bacterium]